MSRTNCYERLISIARQQSFTCCSTTPATYCVPLTEKLKRFLDYKYSRKDMKDIFEKFTSSSPKIIPVSTSNDMFERGNFKIFKNALGQLIPSRPLKHVITSTNWNNFWR